MKSLATTSCALLPLLHLACSKTEPHGESERRQTKGATAVHASSDALHRNHLSELEDALQRGDALAVRGVFVGWGTANLTEAIEALKRVENLDERALIVQNWIESGVSLEGGELKDVVLAMKGNRRESLLRALGSAMAKSHPELVGPTAKEIGGGSNYVTFATSALQDCPRDRLVAVASELTNGTLDDEGSLLMTTAAGALSNLTEEELRSVVASGASNARLQEAAASALGSQVSRDLSLNDAAEHLRDLGEPWRSAALRTAMFRRFEKNPDELLAFAAASGVPDDLRLEAARTGIARTSGKDPDLALQQTLALPEDVRYKTVGTLVMGWLLSDSVEASKRVLEIADPQAKDAGAFQVVAHLAGKGAASEAEQWAATIVDHGMKERALSLIRRKE